MPGSDPIETALSRFGFYPLAPHALRPGADRLRQLALQRSIRLPDDFIRFSTAHGAGAFDQRVGIALPANCPLGPLFVIDILYAAEAPEDWDTLALADDTYAGRLPFDALPLATDAGGSLLVMAPNGAETIFAWDHEHRELDEHAIDHIVAALRTDGVPVDEHDLDQLIRLWEERFPGEVRNPTGHGNLYPVAASYTDLFAQLRPAPAGGGNTP